MGEISKLPNIGPVVEEQLNQVGITTYGQLKEIGSSEGTEHRSFCVHTPPLRI